MLEHQLCVEILMMHSALKQIQVNLFYYRTVVILRLTILRRYAQTKKKVAFLETIYFT